MVHLSSTVKFVVDSSLFLLPAPQVPDDLLSADDASADDTVLNDSEAGDVRRELLTLFKVRDVAAEGCGSGRGSARDGAGRGCTRRDVHARLSWLVLPAERRQGGVGGGGGVHGVVDSACYADARTRNAPGADAAAFGGCLAYKA